jgi:leader peptidase (prepilin peptidase) / N-methyltransferase
VLPLPPVIAVLFFFALGAVLGSFGNVLVERLPTGETLGGRSYCLGCKKTLRVWELVPVLSWCLLRGKCARCKSPIPAVYTIVELISGLLFVVALYYASFDLLTTIPVAVAFWAMFCIALCDMRTRTIPDVLTFIVAVCGVLLRLQDQVLPILPVLIGAGFFGIQWAISRGKWMGSGDILLGGALGILLGTWQLTALMLWLAYILGLLFVLALLPFKKINLNAHIAFGPFIVLGGAIALLFGERIINTVF